MLAALALQELEAFDTKTQAKKNVVQAIERVAERLGNTPAVCRKCYVHPEVLNSYLDGTMLEGLKQQAEQEIVGEPARPAPGGGRRHGAVAAAAGPHPAFGTPPPRRGGVNR